MTAALELDDLGIGDSEDIWAVILELFEEVGPADYVGGRPPMKSYEKKIEGKELFAFAWDSDRLGKRMYLKFALQEKNFVYVSLHHDRKRGKL